MYNTSGANTISLGSEKIGKLVFTPAINAVWGRMWDAEKLGEA